MQLLRKELHAVAGPYGDSALLQQARVLLPSDAVPEEYRDGEGAPIREPIPPDGQEVGDARECHSDRMEVDPRDVSNDVIERVLVTQAGTIKRAKHPADRPKQERPGSASRIQNSLGQW